MVTSRQRVMMSLDHRAPDRVPIDLGGHSSSGMTAIAYSKPNRYLGIKTGDIYGYDFAQQVAIIEPEVLDSFEVDVVAVARGLSLDDENWRDWVLPDGPPSKIPAHIHPVKVGDDW